MPVSFFAVLASAIGLLYLGAGAASAQSYPNKPVRIITGDPGGAVDFTARIVAPAISGPLGQPVLVENRGGGGGAVAIGAAARSAPDGYTLLAYSSAVWLLPLLKDNTGWDPFKNFHPITIADKTPNIVVVHPSVPASSIKQLIALAKARPGALNYSSVGVGSGAHLSTELFKSMANVNIVHVPYKGTAPALNDLISGQVQVMFAIAGIAVPHVKSGRLRALAVTSAKQSALAPELPTVSASGVPGYESTQMFGIYAPAGTPVAIVGRLNQEIVKALNTPDAKSKLLNIGLEVVASSPEDTVSIIKADMAKMGKVIKTVGIRAD